MMPLGDVILGISYGIATTVFLLLYSTIIKVVHTDRELGQSASHRIMFHLGLAECIELASQYSMAILAANGEIFSFTVKKVLGAWATGAWYAYVPLTTLLAINRCVALCFRNRFDEIFSKTKTTTMIACGWMVGLVITGLHLTPVGDYIYVVETYGYRTSNSTSNALLSETTFWISNFNLAITGGLYALIIVKLSYQQWKLKSFGIANKKMRYEVLVFIQAFLISGYLASITYVWHLFAWLGFANQKWSTITVQYLYIFSGGVNPIIYIAMSKKIRHDFLNQLRLCVRAKPRQMVTVTSVVQVQTKLQQNAANAARSQSAYF